MKVLLLNLHSEPIIRATKHVVVLDVCERNLEIDRYPGESERCGSLAIAHSKNITFLIYRLINAS